MRKKGKIEFDFWVTALLFVVAAAVALYIFWPVLTGQVSLEQFLGGGTSYLHSYVA